MKAAINDLISQAHENAKAKGFWDDSRTFGDQIALMHSELSEALEEFREPKTIGGESDPFDPLVTIYVNIWGSPCRPLDAAELFGSDKVQKPEGIAVEFADVLIRIFDTCGKYSIPLADALEMKLAYNKTRPHRHGGKKL